MYLCKIKLCVINTYIIGTNHSDPHTSEFCGSWQHIYKRTYQSLCVLCCVAIRME